MVGLNVLSSSVAAFFPCIFFLWVARSCAGLYFYANDYPSWISTVMVFRNTSILKETGWLQMNPYTNATVGRALYKKTFEMQNSTNGSLCSFNTSFVFSMNTDRAKEYYGDGLAFLICPNPFRGEDLQVSSGGYLGMFNSSTVGMLKNKVFAVEFDTHQNLPFKDPNDNHIGVDLNSVISLKTNNLSTLGIILNEGKKLVCWVDYDGLQRHLWVYLALSPSNKPSKPAVSMALDLAPYMKDNMYVGFTSATGTRAELHTIYSWWFLSGFGNLTLPLLPSTSARPLAKLAQRNIVIAVFSLAVMVGFLYLLCIYARRRWQRRARHLIDILLPVACWMFWKESISCEVQSTRCLKLASPSVELLAWLWRTRFTRTHYQLHVMTWWEVLVKLTMGSYQRGQAWLRELKRPKRCKLQGAVHVVVFEESSEEDGSGDEGGSRVRVKVTKHMKMHPVDERKGEENKVFDGEDEASGPLPAIGRQHEANTQVEDGPAHGRYLIGTNSFIVLEESEAQLFQRRGSFLIPQGAPIDGGQQLVEPRKDVGPVILSMATTRALSRQKVTDTLEVGFETGPTQLQPETSILSGNAYSDKFFRRRGSFFVHPEDVGLMGTSLSVETAQDFPALQAFAKHDADIGESRRGIDVASPSPQSPKETLGSPKSKSASAHVQVQPETIFITSDDSSSHQFFRRGSFFVHSDDAIDLMGATSSTETVTEPPMRYLVEHDSDRDSRRGIDRRRSFMLPRGEHDVATTTKERDIRGGSFVIVEDASSQMPKVREQASVSVLRQGPLLMSVVDHKCDSSSAGRMNVRRGSFIFDEDAGSSSMPEARHQTKEIVDASNDDGLQGESTNKYTQPLQHPSGADDDSKSHVAHRWLFD